MANKTDPTNSGRRPHERVSLVQSVRSVLQLGFDSHFAISYNIYAPLATTYFPERGLDHLILHPTKQR